MAEFLSYNEFLNESTVINDFDNSSFLLKTLDIAKKSKLLKYKAQEYSHDSQFSIRFGDFYGEINNRRTLDISMGTQKYSVCYLEEVRGEYGPSYNATDIRIAIFSEDPINLKMIEEVFPVIVKGTGGTQIRTLTRDIIDDYSTTAKTLSVSVRRVQDWNVSYSPNGHKILYYVSFNYHVTKEDKQSVTFEQIKNLPEYKDLITSLPVEMCSSPIRLKKLTLLFGLKLPKLNCPLIVFFTGTNFTFTGTSIPN